MPVDDGGHFVACTSCGASTNLRFSCGDDAAPIQAEAWNRRVADGVRAVDGGQPVMAARSHDVSVDSKDRQDRVAQVIADFADLPWHDCQELARRIAGVMASGSQTEEPKP
jgi:hypothetical protein